MLGLVLAAVGCGGDGSTVGNGSIPSTTNTAQNNVSNGPSSGDVGLFITDDLSAKYDHVWVSIKKVELKLAAGGLRTIYEDSRGVGVDLASLHSDSGPKYQFINELTMPAGTYVGAQITLAKDAVMFPTNATSGKDTEFANQQSGAQDAVLSVTFDPPKLLGTGHDDLVLDFDLSKWDTDSSGKLVTAVTPSLGAGLEDADRNASVVEDGTVDDLKGDVPTQTFTLKNQKLPGINVFTSATTALDTEMGSDPLVLKKDQTVEVSGSFDTNTRQFNATAIRLEDPKAPVVAQVSGPVSGVDAKNGTWSVTPAETHGLLPSGLVIPVTLSSSAKFFGSSGLEMSKDDFISALSASKSVDVLSDGTYDSAKGQFLATESRLLDAASQPEVKVAGVVANPQSSAQTFGLTVTGFQGLMTKPGANATVSVTAATSFIDENGKTLTSDQFFADLAQPKAADVDGVLDTSSGNVLASTVKLSAAPVIPVTKGGKNAKVAKTSK